MGKRIFLILCLLTTSVFAVPSPKNTVVISIDGASREIVAALLQKGKIPHMQEVADAGGFRNMNIGNYLADVNTTYTAIFTGRPLKDTVFPLMKNQTIFEELKLKDPSLNMGLIWSMPKSVSSDVSFLFSELYQESWASQFPYIERDMATVTSEAVHFIKDTKSPFVLFMNFNEADYIGRRYREGTQTYSNAIQSIDQHLGQVFEALKSRKMWESTFIIITTNYGFFPKSQRYKMEKNVWFMTNYPIAQSGNQSDIATTILYMNEINPKARLKPLIGKMLVVPPNKEIFELVESEQQ